MKWSILLDRNLQQSRLVSFSLGDCWLSIRLGGYLQIVQVYTYDRSGIWWQCPSLTMLVVMPDSRRTSSATLAPG